MRTSRKVVLVLKPREADMLLARALLLVTLAFGILLAPLAADAQQPAKVPKIGFLCPFFKPGPPLEALRRGLRELGYVEGKNIVIESRFAELKLERFPHLADDLVRLKVDVLIPMGVQAIHVAQQATRTIPIVMPGAHDPVGSGYVASLARPGGNITGMSLMSPELSGKRLELLKEALPGLGRVAVLWNPSAATVLAWRETEVAARALGVQVQSLEVRGPDDLDRAFQAALRGRAAALITLRDSLTYLHRHQIVELAEKNRRPTMHEDRDWVNAGGLMSYGPELVDFYRRAATYVDKILKGAKPSDLPVEQPTRFELVINRASRES